MDYGADCDGRQAAVYETFDKATAQFLAGTARVEEQLKTMRTFDNALCGICIVCFDGKGRVLIEQGNKAFYRMDGETVVGHICPLFLKKVQEKHQASNVRVHFMQEGEELTFQINGIPFYFGNENQAKILLTCEKIKPVEIEKNKIYKILTKRETEILHLVVNGYKNRFIAHRLQISEGTVKKMLSNIYRKLSISSRTELIRLYLEHVGL